MVGRLPWCRSDGGATNRQLEVGPGRAELLADGRLIVPHTAPPKDDGRGPKLLDRDSGQDTDGGEARIIRRGQEKGQENITIFASIQSL